MCVCIGSSCLLCGMQASSVLRSQLVRTLPSCRRLTRGPHQRRCARSSTRRPSRTPSPMTQTAGARECAVLGAPCNLQSATKLLRCCCVQACCACVHQPGCNASLQVEPLHSAAGGGHFNHTQPLAALHPLRPGVCKGVQYIGWAEGLAACRIWLVSRFPVPVYLLARCVSALAGTFVAWCGQHDGYDRCVGSPHADQPAYCGRHNQVRH